MGIHNQPKRDLLSLFDLRDEEFTVLFQRATTLKRKLERHEPVHSLDGRTLAMLFEKSSTRTRVSFEAGMFQLGGKALFLSSRDIQLGRGEGVKDSARVLSRYVDGIMVRTFDHANVEIMAEYASVPVINGLTDTLHPCQVLADIFTFEEKRGSLKGKRVAWVGDGNNMANTWIQAAVRYGFHLTLACPLGYEPDGDILSAARKELAEREVDASLTLVRDPRQGVDRAHLVTTDVWTSMGQEGESDTRKAVFAAYQVDSGLMAAADAEALFMHCLPAHRGEEVTAAVLEGSQSVVWDEAENRLHVQKAILEFLMLGGVPAEA
ncbi:ornithine carbamoyltransferase [Magnetococcus marinus MC-1]|uniref:Ornithine carbamoyltransferase n=1 Tax=Magnetococcus marinus (strain ATCC BAA-1437 / JCM 17883 / MC-1) TaxID=156889 RepID=A0LE35_MAGMM|nr:ornithine carbamoyltransferase [Magnetococcus marinus]ABK46228.1 ornithine carbamoyltransferase [Magnetococcus marinus MC-1]